MTLLQNGGGDVAMARKASARVSAIVLDSKDNVAVALVDIPVAASVILSGMTADGLSAIQARQEVPFGHKIAIRPIPLGRHVVKYGYPIGAAKVGIDPGDHVHVHNVRSNRGIGDCCAAGNLATAGRHSDCQTGSQMDQNRAKNIERRS